VGQVDHARCAGNVFMFVGRAWMSHSRGLAVERVTAAMVYEQALGVCGALLAVAVLFPFWEYRPGVTASASRHSGLWPHAPAHLRAGTTGPCVSAAAAARVTLASAPCSACSAFHGLLAGVGAWLLARAVTGLGVETCRSHRRHAPAYVADGGLLHPQRHRRAGGGAHGVLSAPSWWRGPHPASSARVGNSVELVFVGLVVGIEVARPP
jgi:hypothetical protein